jgi:hypothetical protein
MTRADRRRAVARYELTMARARALGMTHGRKRKRWAQQIGLAMLISGYALFFVAWTIGLAYLILLLTN